MNALERLDRMFESGYISAEQWKKQREYYEEQLLKKYLNGEITLEEICEMLDK